MLCQGKWALTFSLSQECYMCEMGKGAAVLPRNVAEMNMCDQLKYHSDGYWERIVNREMNTDVKYCQNPA